jgi:hypothetical protein
MFLPAIRTARADTSLTCRGDYPMDERKAGGNSIQEALTRFAFQHVHHLPANAEKSESFRRLRISAAANPSSTVNPHSTSTPSSPPNPAPPACRPEERSDEGSAVAFLRVECNGRYSVMQVTCPNRRSTRNARIPACWLSIQSNSNPHFAMSLIGVRLATAT